MPAALRRVVGDNGDYRAVGPNIEIPNGGTTCWHLLKLAAFDIKSQQTANRIAIGLLRITRPVPSQRQRALATGRIQPLFRHQQEQLRAIARPRQCLDSAMRRAERTVDLAIFDHKWPETPRLIAVREKRDAVIAQ